MAPTTPDAPTRAPPAPWVGWRRSRGGKRWIASEGQTEAEAFARLLDRAKEDRSGSHDMLVLPRGQEP